MLVQPIYWQEELIGGFTVVWITAQHRFTPDELRLAEGIALQGALAIENSRLYEGVKQQMAELKQTQAQLVQSTKLAAIGELPGDIAHEINNPLTTVLGFASFIAERLPAEDPMREELGLIQEEASRARDIVRDLLQFKPPARLHARAGGPQCGPRAGGGHGPPSGRAEHAHGQRGLRVISRWSRWTCRASSRCF